MGSFLACNLAFLQYLFRLYIFKKPYIDGSGPMLSCILVMVAVLTFMLNTSLYPEYLRKLGKIGNFLIQYLLAVFLMEHIMADFWFPLDIFITGGFCNLGGLLEDFLDTYELNCSVVCTVLKSQALATYVDILIALLILAFTLQATRVIDFGLLQECGIKFFFWDIIKRCWFYKKYKSSKSPKPQRRQSSSKSKCFVGRQRWLCDEEEDSD